jgi:lipopolysaccharide transport system ATP-binding protein
MGYVVLSVRGVSKKFTRSLKRSLYYGLHDILSELSGSARGSPRLRPGEFWAVKDVSFDVEEGAALGLVGPNGSGKTTLLRLISGIIKLDEGEIRVRGRVAPLIALGAGFNPVLSGRENIFVNLAILGLNHLEIRDRFDEIVSFAELGEAIDAPVQTYSSGMNARLGFSCAVHTSPDILLVDEVLSVGDIRFRAKCYRRLAELRRAGTSLILVSHSTNVILSICDRVLYISRGEPVMLGTPTEVMHKFESDLAIVSAQSSTGELVMPEKMDSTGVDIVRVFFRGDDGSVVKELYSGGKGSLCILCRVRPEVPRIGVAIIIRQANGEPEPVLNMNSERDGVDLSVSTGSVEIMCNFEPLCLRPGVYSAKLAITGGPHDVLDAVESFMFQVRGHGSAVDSMYFQPRRWSLNGSC